MLCASTTGGWADYRGETVSFDLLIKGALVFPGDRPHPRLYGTVARVLGRYALKERLIPVEEAVARLTARAADRIGLTDRGRIERGCAPTSCCSTRTLHRHRHLQRSQAHPRGYQAGVGGRSNGLGRRRIDRCAAR